MAKKENALPVESDVITPLYQIGCGTRTRRDCCFTDENCRMEMKVFPNGDRIYTDLCCTMEVY